MKFSFSQIDQDLYLIEKQYTSKKQSHGSDITGPYWMLIEVKVIAGDIWWMSGGKKIIPTQKSLFIFLPSFTWAIEHCSENTSLKIRGLISRKKINLPNFSEPILFYSKKSLPQTERQVVALLESVAYFELVGANSNPSKLSERVKNLIDRNYLRSIEIQEIAAKLKSSSAALSRRFKQSPRCRDRLVT